MNWVEMLLASKFCSKKIGVIIMLAPTIVVVRDLVGFLFFLVFVGLGRFKNLEFICVCVYKW